MNLIESAVLELRGLASHFHRLGTTRGTATGRRWAGQQAEEWAVPLSLGVPTDGRGRIVVFGRRNLIPSYSCCQCLILPRTAGRSVNSSDFHYRVNMSQQQLARQLHTDETTRHPGGRAALHLPKQREEERQHRAQGQPHTRNVQSSLALARRGRWEEEGSGRILTQFTGPDGEVK